MKILKVICWFSMVSSLWFTLFLFLFAAKYAYIEMTNPCIVDVIQNINICE